MSCTPFSRKKNKNSSSSLAASAPPNGQSTQAQQLPPQQLTLPPNWQSHSYHQQQLPVHPWSEHRLNLLPPTFLSKDVPYSGPSPSPFPRYGSAASAVAGKLFLFGGRVHNSLFNDLYAVSTRDLNATLLQTRGEIPSPRVGHASVLISSVLLIWGGSSVVVGESYLKGSHDDSLYLLNLVSRVWTRVVVNGPCPEGRYCHAVTMVGSKLFVFGGHIDGKSLNDMWAFDLNSLQSSPVWDSYKSALGDKEPLPRGGHVLVTIGDRIILFGGALGQYHYNDTWLFDIQTRKWTELQCTGDIPSPRHGHAAVVVDDVLYVFGGRGVDGALGDLSAFQLSTQRWFILEKMGPSPSGRLFHTMASDGTRIFVLGGKSSTIGESALIHVFDTKHIKYPDPDLKAVKPSEKTIQDNDGKDECLVDFERQLSATPAAQTEQVQRLAQLANELALKSAKLEEVEANAAEATKRAGLELRKHAGRLLAQTSLVEQKNAELVSMQAKLDELLLSRDQHVHALEQALQKAASRAADADERSERASKLIKQYDTELAGVHDELGAKKSELEAVRLRLTDAENALAKSKAEAEANAAEATKRAGLELREHVDRLFAQTSLVEQKDAKLVDMQTKLDELLLFRDEAQSVLQKASSCAADADERSQRACEKTGKYETELLGVRAELEARKSELEAVRLRLMDAEIGWAKSKTEADTLRAMTAAGLASMDEDRIARRLIERMRAMEAEVASLRLSEKGSELLQSRNEG